MSYVEMQTELENTYAIKCTKISPLETVEEVIKSRILTRLPVLWNLACV